MPTENSTEYLMVTSTFDFVKEAMTLRDDQAVYVVFGKQNGSMDCFHRAVDFVGRIMEGDVLLTKLVTMPYPITTTGAGVTSVTVPTCFYGGI